MTPEQRKLARHALGLNDKMQSYRNRFVSYGTMDEWEALVDAGMAKSTVIYTLTATGAKAVLETGEKLDPEDFPEAA